MAYNNRKMETAPEIADAHDLLGAGPSRENIATAKHIAKLEQENAELKAKLGHPSIFNFTQEQLNKLEAWRLLYAPHGSLIFQPFYTGMGSGIKVMFHEYTLDLTDYESW